MTILRRLRATAIAVLYACACLQFVRFYVKSSIFYLKMPLYLAGTERLPFQERILPLALLEPMYRIPRLLHLFTHAEGAVPSQSGPFYVVSLIGMLAAAVLTQLLYRKVSETRALEALVFPLFLFCVIWTYCLHNEANYSYPYDLFSLAFFTAGLLCIYTRRFLPLLLIMLVGTFNRETTLFLVGIYVLDAASTAASEDMRHGWLQRAGLDLRSVSWWRASALLAVWLTVKGGLAYHFRYNSHSEDFVRFGYNTARMRIRLLPALLNICGYMLPVVLFYWSRIRPRRFANYAYILLAWLPIMFYSGVLVETRIYGELCSWTAIALVLLAERHTAALRIKHARVAVSA